MDDAHKLGNRIALAVGESIDLKALADEFGAMHHHLEKDGSERAVIFFCLPGHKRPHASA